MGTRHAFAAALAFAASCGLASAQVAMPEGRVYVFHSKPTGPCPSLDWHVVVGANNSLSGMIAWDNMQKMARATGSFNASNRTFQMTAHEVGGQQRTATITGSVEGNGWLTANIKGPNISCQNINVPWYQPGPQGSG